MQECQRDISSCGAPLQGQGQPPSSCHGHLTEAEPAYFQSPAGGFWLPASSALVSRNRSGLEQNPDHLCFRGSRSKHEERLKQDHEHLLVCVLVFICIITLIEHIFIANNAAQYSHTTHDTTKMHVKFCEFTGPSQCVTSHILTEVSFLQPWQCVCDSTHDLAWELY